MEDCAGIAALGQHAAYLDSLDQALRQTLPSAMQGQVRLACVKGRRLVFLVPSSALASRLRTLQQGIFRTAQSLGLDVDALSIKMALWSAPAIVADTTPKPLSVSSARHLTAAAAHIADPQLRAMFLKLAAQAKTPTGS